MQKSIKSNAFESGTLNPAKQSRREPSSPSEVQNPQPRDPDTPSSDPANGLSIVEEARREFEDVCNNAPVAYFVHGYDPRSDKYQIIKINKRALSLFGLDSFDPELTLDSLVTEKSRQLFRYRLRRAGDQQTSSVELTLIRPGNRPTTVLAETSPPRLGLFQTVMVDITDQKQVAKERREFETRMRQSQKLELLYQLSGGIAHDFNNLLQILEIQVDSAVLLAGDENQKLIGVVRQISEAVQRGSRLTQRLMAFSRQTPLEKIRDDLNRVLAESISVIARTFDDSMDLVFTPSSEPLGVWIDPVQIEQMLFNLCLNSRDATLAGSSGKGSLKIHTSSVEINTPLQKSGLNLFVGSYARLTVADNGCGISDRVLNNIFEPFVTTKKTGRGTGLGLAIVHNIIRQHEGAIEVTESSPTGTTIDIYLPRFSFSSILNRGSDKTTSDDINLATQGERTALVADDEEAIRSALQQKLESCGTKVLLAADGAEAISLLDRHPEIELLLTDVVMPIKGGLEVCEHYRKTNSSGTVVLMSGHGDSVLDKDFLRNHNATFLQKPFGFTNLEKRLGLSAACNPSS